MGRSRSLPELGRIVGPGVASGLTGLMRLSNLIIKQSQEQSSYVQQSIINFALHKYKPAFRLDY